MNRPMLNWSSSSGSPPRLFSKNCCRFAGRSIRRSNGCTRSRLLMDRKEVARRRRQFMRMIGKDAIAILPAAPIRHRNGDIEYAYRQDSHFYYLSGFPEPDAVAVLVPGRPQAEYL